MVDVVCVMVNVGRVTLAVIGVACDIMVGSGTLDGEKLMAGKHGECNIFTTTVVCVMANVGRIYLAVKGVACGWLAVGS
jgi:hypothetical protein